MANQVLVPQQRLTLNDASGTPVAGGSVTVLRSQTNNTLADIYSDADATIRLDNPVALDSSGSMVAVFFSGDHEVRAIVRDADGNLVNDYDPCPLLFSNGSSASTLSFSPTGDNAGTTVQEAVELASTPRSVEQGGTGATTAEAARTNLGIGSAATGNLLDEDDMASDSETGVPSQQSVAAFVRDSIDEIIERQIVDRSPVLTGAAGDTLTFNHDLGARPDGVTIQAICTTADGGMDVDQVTELDTSSTGDIGVQIVYSTAQVQVRLGASGIKQTISMDGTATDVTLNAANFEFIIIATRFRVDPGDI